MSRYIDADALLEELKEELEFDSPMYNEVENKWLDKGLRIAIKDVKHFPTADVVEVRHGEWEDRYENKYANQLYECSLCGEIAPEGTKYNKLGNPERIQVLSPYCPNCGADMRGERSEG